MTQQNMLTKPNFAISAKISWFSKKYDVSAKFDESAKWAEL